MIRSMTAFARFSAPAKEGQWVIEIRSLNHRFLEFSLKIPPGLAALESRVRDLVQETLRRGKVMVSVSRETADGKTRPVAIDEDVVKLYLASIQKVQKKFKIKGELTVSDLIRLPNIFTAEETSDDTEKTWPPLKKALESALEKAIKSREVEGAKLAKDISARLDTVAQAVKKIQQYTENQSEKIYARLTQRLEALLKDPEKDTERISKEVAFLVERGDITEEMVRMKSHLNLFGSKLKATGELGRELDFLCQEMNREVNTMASKSQHFEISTEVVLMKGELEKIREQIQNIE